MDTATDKEKFDVLYQRLKVLNDGALDAVFKATAAILVVCGWLITSDKALPTLRANLAARDAAVLVVIMFGVLYAIAAARTVRQSALIVNQLNALAFMPRTVYADQRLSVLVAAPYVVVNIAVCVALICLIVGST